MPLSSSRTPTYSAVYASLLPSARWRAVPLTVSSAMPGSSAFSHWARFAEAPTRFWPFHSQTVTFRASGGIMAL